MLPVVRGLELIADINAIHIMVIRVDCRWDGQILLVLPIEYLPYFFLSWGICFCRPSAPRYRRICSSKYGTNEKDDLRILPGKLVDLREVSLYSLKRD